jgi:precorrin-6A/cobalt-precorrin-6A reductase
LNAGGVRRPVLVLGGTTEARELAAALNQATLPVISSLAGRLLKPRLPAGEVRIGGFGGPAALASWLVEHNVAVVVDATHPFAEQISTSAVTACASAGVPLLRLDRPGWKEQAGDRWHWADDLSAAAELAPRLGGRILLTIGRQGLAAFAAARSAWFLVRCVEPPDSPLPPYYELLLNRGPFTLAGELALIRCHAIDLIVTRDSGGAPTAAKLEAARLSGLPVIVVRRPPCPEVTSAADVATAFEWVRSIVHAE